jgi:peptide/nickel transport system permease protein
MLGYITRRVVGTVPVILLISLLVFVLVHAAPGSPEDLLLPEDATDADVAEARQRWGLDQPIWIQYWRFLIAALHGDLGTSFRFADPVVGVIVAHLPATIELAVISIIIAVVFAVPLGVWAGAKPNSWIDNLGSLTGFFGISMPNFWFGIMLIVVFSGILNLLPSSGRDTYGVASEPITGFYLLDSTLKGNWSELKDGLSYILMPAIALGTNMMGILMRVTRSSVMEVMHEDYITTARAKGATERSVLWHHGLRNALIPIITVVGLELGSLLSGSIIVETVFSWPGVGQLLITAISNRDYPLVAGVVLTYTVAFVIINLIVDLLYALIDPRIRFDKQ